VIYLNTVEPIRDMDIVLDIADYLKSKNERDYVLFMFGIYSGLRISDILPIRVRDVRDKDFIYKGKRKLIRKEDSQLMMI
jgi:integrase